MFIMHCISVCANELMDGWWLMCSLLISRYCIPMIKYQMTNKDFRVDSLKHLNEREQVELEDDTRHTKLLLAANAPNLINSMENDNHNIINMLHVCELWMCVCEYGRSFMAREFSIYTHSKRTLFELNWWHQYSSINEPSMSDILFTYSRHLPKGIAQEFN